MSSSVILTNRRSAIGTSVCFSAIAIFSGLVTNFAGLMSDPLKYIFYTVSLIFGYGAIYIALLYSTNKNIKKYLRVWTLVIFYLLIVGAIRSDFFANGFNVGTFLAQDLRFVMYVGIGILLADSPRILYFQKIIHTIAYISIIFGIIALANFNFDYAMASEGARLGIWSLPYYLWWASGSVYAYMYPYYRLSGKNKVAGIGSLFVYLLLGLMFIKRSVAVNAIITIVLTEIFVGYEKKQKHTGRLSATIKIILIIAVLLGIGMAIPYTRVLLISLAKRFFSQGNLFEYDRAQEATVYFRGASISELIFGQGIGHYVVTYRELNGLHIGVYNLIYKGGVFLLFIYIYIFLRIISLFLHRKEMRKNQLIWLTVAVSYVICMLYEGTWSYTIYMIQYVTPIVCLLGCGRTNGDKNNQLKNINKYNGGEI